jgi:hypothetical protein
LLMGLTFVGQELIGRARVRNVIDYRSEVHAAYLSCQGRYRGLPGDCVNAVETIRNVAGNGYGDGRIEPPEEAAMGVVVNTATAGMATTTAGTGATKMATHDGDGGNGIGNAKNCKGNGNGTAAGTGPKCSPPAPGRNS